MIRTTMTGLLPLGVLAIATLSSPAAARAGLDPGEYDVTAQTVLPHLEEALRYATTRTRQCLDESDTTHLFPLLEHPAFAGCRLVPDSSAGDSQDFILACENPEAASGSATVRTGAHHMNAVLELKMGGKNMTLSQRLYATRVGPCPGKP